MRIICSRRGSQIVEAAIVLPFIIVFSVLSIAVMAYYCELAEDMSRLGADIRRMTADNSDTVESIGVSMNADEYEEWNIRSKSGLFNKTLIAEKTGEVTEKRLFRLKVRRDYYVRHACINEANNIWRRQLVEELIDD